MTWANVVSWILVIVGWILVHKAALKRERRKEKRDIASKYIVELYDLERDAIKFHSGKIFDAHTSEPVIIGTNRLIRKAQRLPLNEIEIPNYFLVALRKSITLKNMGMSDFKQQDVLCSEIIKGIKTAIDDIVDHIESKKEEIWT